MGIPTVDIISKAISDQSCLNMGPKYAIKHMPVGSKKGLPNAVFSVVLHASNLVLRFKIMITLSPDDKKENPNF